MTMYLTVREGNAEDSTNHTWTEVNTYDTYYYHDLGIERYACEAILQVGDENGPKEGEFGYGETTPNATVCVRGQTSSRQAQKNYKVRIKDGKGTYKDMQTVPLNKYVSDSLRFRNKLVFDLMQPIPQMTSIRTQFVHLYVKDETEGGNGEFVDYGLYTRLEQMNKTYLKNHGLDNKGYLYKVVYFEWYNEGMVTVDPNDPRFDELKFEEILKPKGDADTSKLREVISAVNDYTVPIEQIVQKYFDVENFSYFVAYQILIGNYDVGPRNQYMYSPLNSDKWYFLSWDCDDSFFTTENELDNFSDGQSWEHGMTQFVVLILFNRLYRVKEYRDALTDAVNDIYHNYLNPEKVTERIETYKSIVLPYVQRLPDSEYWKLDLDTYNYVADSLCSEIATNYELYFDTLERPWPFYVGLPEKYGDGIKINWDISYDIDGEDITYTCILARDSGFTDVIAEESDIKVPEVYFDVNLAPGNYFIRVISKNESGYTQECFDYYNKDPNFKGKRYGCMSFIANADGTFSTDINKE